MIQTLPTVRPDQPALILRPFDLSRFVGPMDFVETRVICAGQPGELKAGYIRGVAKPESVVDKRKRQIRHCLMDRCQPAPAPAGRCGSRPVAP